jgi:cytochrome c oxidase assembly factor CtaG
MLPNRIAVYLTSVAALLTAVAPVVANLDLTSTIGLVGGLGAVALVVKQWLAGWAKYEERVDLMDLTGDQFTVDAPGSNPSA